MTRDEMTRPASNAEAYCAYASGRASNQGEMSAYALHMLATNFANQSESLREAWLAEHDDHPDKQKADALEKQRHETALILQDVRRVLGIDLTPLPRFDYFTWTQVVAQTILGEVERLAECEADLATARGLLERAQERLRHDQYCPARGFGECSCGINDIVIGIEAFLSPAQPEPPKPQEPARCRKCNGNVHLVAMNGGGWVAKCSTHTLPEVHPTPDAALAAWQKVNATPGEKV